MARTARCPLAPLIVGTKLGPFVPVPPRSSISHPVCCLDFKGSTAGELPDPVRRAATAGVLGAGVWGDQLAHPDKLDPAGGCVGTEMASGLAIQQPLTRPWHARAT